ncbi:hypothetical protein [Ligilactobacillus aviarius]|uniref:Uncharacterized protein n=1 Tax=Ligilactobacillus aviarius TaxID=1606 RepID=A0A179C6Q8_9LACO|nr:hypothetical protein [Ligilactobacillus aviarius]OAP97403.1 hypothetical protein A3O07_00910 [Ligilactobacillus aviarius]OAQ00926.1 hypothetical protein A3O09_03920 [Ligilactobacillus aviarius]OAQ01191.1 hypothetical protein A3O08_02805 [Ligilactobacillus aviarius]OAQ06055.1 hypothetical protein A3O13_02000 [Ligilactobacillus aviarius]OAQ08726.1 hypothetical protein A3O14_03320 [Ligilactobacillus aviarius]
MEVNQDLMELLAQVALRKSELGTVAGLYPVRIKNEYGYFIIYVGTRKNLIKGFSQVATNENLRIELSSLDDDQTLHYVAVPDVLVLEKSLMLMLYRIGRLNQRIIEDAKKSN